MPEPRLRIISCFYTNLIAVQAQYKTLANKLHHISYDALDVTTRKWFPDLLAFSNGVEGLEKQLSSALNLAYNTAGHLSCKLRLLPVSHFPFNRHTVKASGLICLSFTYGR